MLYIWLDLINPRSCLNITIILGIMWGYRLYLELIGIGPLVFQGDSPHRHTASHDQSHQGIS